MNGFHRLRINPCGCVLAFLLTFALGLASTPAHASSDHSPFAYAARYDYPGFNTGAVGDVNGDGIVDLVGQLSSPSGYAVYFGNGDGTFSAGPISPNTNVGPPIALYDFNADGKLDLILAGIIPGGGVAIALGNGDGTFEPPVPFTITTSDQLYTYSVGDFNGDGIPDVAAGGFQGVWISLGVRGGGFLPGILAPVSYSPGYPALPALGDFNHDGNLDVAWSIPAGFVVLFGDGTGHFPKRLTVPILIRDAILEFIVNTGDVNGDGIPDILATNFSQSYTKIYISNGDGTFQAPYNTDIALNGTLAVADVNHDGIPDLVSDSVNIAYGIGGGKFQAPIAYPIGNFGKEEPGWGLIITDLRGNGQLDILAGELISGTSILLNRGNGTYDDGLFSSLAVPSGCVSVGDLNGNGISDVVLTADSGFQVLLGTGNPADLFSSAPMVPANRPVFCPLISDVNGDGKPDLVTLTETTSQTYLLTAYLGDGTGDFQVAPSTTLTYPDLYVVADFNGDGKPDVATLGNQLAIGNGDGTFQPPQPFIPYVQPQNRGFSDIATGDLNGDGRPDIVLSDSIDGLLYILINEGGGSWKEGITSVGSPETLSCPTVAIGDVNGDGKPDLLLGCNDYVVLAINQGNGEFQFSQKLQAFADQIFVTDVNGDGIADIVTHASTRELAVFYGLGAGQFSEPVHPGALDSSIGIGNFHGQPADQGRPDIVVAGGKLQILLNKDQ